MPRATARRTHLRHGRGSGPPRALPGEAQSDIPTGTLPPLDTVSETGSGTASSASFCAGSFVADITGHGTPAMPSTGVFTDYAPSGADTAFCLPLREDTLRWYEARINRAIDYIARERFDMTPSEYRRRRHYQTGADREGAHCLLADSFRAHAVNGKA